MIKLLSAALIALVFSSTTAHAVNILWVGDSAACTGSFTHPTIESALLSADFTGSDDEIRLTRTRSYSTIDINWSDSLGGELTIAGGYSDCFTAEDGRTRIGNTAGPIIRITSPSGSSGTVTLKNLIVTGSTSLRGLEVIGSGTEVTVENSVIEDNIAGVFVGGGAAVTIDANSTIRDNFSSMSEVQFGGGIRCQNSGSRVFMAGVVQRNLAFNGGNIWLGNGCLFELQGGAVIEGGLAAFGGGIFVDNFGVLESRGGSSRVVIRDNSAEDGGGLYLRGQSGFANLVNTLFIENYGLQGSAIYAVDGGRGSIPRLTIDRSQDCPFLISCSEFEANTGPASTVFAFNTTIDIQRTLFDRNFSTDDESTIGNIDLDASNAVINRVGFIGNETYAAIRTFSANALIRHITVVGNTFPGDPSLDSWATSHRGSGSIQIYNSTFVDTRGQDGPPVLNFSGECNLVDNLNNWPSGTAIQGTALFINAAGGDLRQLPSSPGVDMCNAQPGAPANDRDLEFQLVPVNEFTNPQGQPGQAGGLWDAGVDEVYSTIGDDEFTLTVARDGTGTGFVISSPVGISCGSDCSETYFQGTLVTLTATATFGSEFTGWIGCPLPQGNQCLNTIDADRTITATFENDEFTLSVNLDGPGIGQVTSSPSGINCGTDCSEVYAVGTLVTLTATPDPGNEFINWVGCPLANGNECLNTVDADRTITAVFDTEQFRLDVEKIGTGAGYVDSTPAGIDCGADCSQLYLPDTMVTLTATPNLDNLFLRWVDCPSPIGNQCQIGMTEDFTIKVRFEDEDVIFADQFEFE